MAIHLTTLTPAQIREVLELAKSQASLVDRSRIDRLEDLLARDVPTPELQRLVTAIDSLPATAKSELLTLVWLGMGMIDNDPGSWAELLQVAQKDRINDVPERLALMAGLHEYLHCGLERVG